MSSQPSAVRGALLISFRLQLKYYVGRWLSLFSNSGAVEHPASVLYSTEILNTVHSALCDLADLGYLCESQAAKHEHRSR